jgi:hypothetical protein
MTVIVHGRAATFALDDEAEFSQNTILSKQGIPVKSDQPILHFSKKIEVRTWPLVHVHSFEHSSLR